MGGAGGPGAGGSSALQGQARCGDRLSGAPADSWRARSSGSDPLCPGRRGNRDLAVCSLTAPITVTEQQREEGFPRVPSLAVPCCRALAGASPQAPEHPPALSPQFVLKHEALAHLREVALFPNTLNPHEAESLALVEAMVGQVMELHPGARWLHIGCDEVGACVASHAGPVRSSAVSSLHLSHLGAAALNQQRGPRAEGQRRPAEEGVQLRPLVSLTGPRPGRPVTWVPAPGVRRGRAGPGTAVLPAPPPLQWDSCPQGWQWVQV